MCECGLRFCADCRLVHLEACHELMERVERGDGQGAPRGILAASFSPSRDGNNGGNVRRSASEGVRVIDACVVLDVDGVLAHFIRGFRQLGHERFGTPPPDDAPQLEWGAWEHLTPAQVDALWGEVNGSPTFWRCLDSMLTHDDVRALWLLARCSELVYLSSRPEGALAQTYGWLVAKGLPPGMVIHKHDKAAALPRLPAPVIAMVEDSPHQLRKLSRAGVPVVVRDHPYNRDEFASLERVTDLAAFCRLAEDRLRSEG